MAVVFQEYGRSLFPWMRVRENVELPLQPARSSARRGAASWSPTPWSRSASPTPHEAYPWQLSGGMQQRVAIARALAYEPEVLLMDEPFAAVDAQTRADLEDLVRGLWRRARRSPILFVTHDIDEAVYLGERVLILSASPTVVQEQLKIDLPARARPVAHPGRPRASPNCAPMCTSRSRRPSGQAPDQGPPDGSAVPSRGRGSSPDMPVGPSRRWGPQGFGGAPPPSPRCGAGGSRPSSTGDGGPPVSGGRSGPQSEGGEQRGFHEPSEIRPRPRTAPPGSAGPAARRSAGPARTPAAGWSAAISPRCHGPLDHRADRRQSRAPPAPRAARTAVPSFCSTAWPRAWISRVSRPDRRRSARAASRRSPARDPVSTSVSARQRLARSAAATSCGFVFHCR